EISIPSDKQVIINSALASYNNSKDPATESPNTNLLNSKMLVTLISDNNKYGIALVTTIISGCTGETSKTSIVPRSFSRTIDTAVIITQTSIRMSAITPGTKLCTLFSCGL